MVLGVTSSAQLKQIFGNSGAASLMARMEAWRASFNSSGQVAEIVYFDEPLSVVSFGLESTAVASPGDPHRVRDVITSISIRLLGEGERLEAIVLLGGPRIVPHFQESNPVASEVLDPDTSVLTDQPYAELGMDPIPIGRIPDDGTSSPVNFEGLLQNTIDARRSRPAAQGSLLVLNDEWGGMSGDLLARLRAPNDVRLAPGWGLTPQRVSELEVRYLHFALHGFADSPDWKSYNPARFEYTTVVNPSTLRLGSYPATTIFCANCYGGVLADRTVSNSCALALLSRGAVQMVAATGTTFGSRFGNGHPLEFGDLLGANFWEHINAGLAPGQALQSALASFRGSTNIYARKTHRQFLLLGDPTLN